jgi:hypothetical protein
MCQSAPHQQCGKPFFSNTRQNGEWTEISTRHNEIELAIAFFRILKFFFPELHPLYTVVALFKKKNNTNNIDDFSLLIQKKKLQQNKGIL